MFEGASYLPSEYYPSNKGGHPQGYPLQNIIHPTREAIYWWHCMLEGWWLGHLLCLGWLQY